MTDYQLHPLCTLFPRMAGAEFEALKADIAANGLRQPIVLHQDMILDGGNRYRACLEAGVEPHFVPFQGGQLVSFVLSANLHRRHMTPGQQAAIVASAQDWAKAQTHGGDRRSDQSATLHLDSVAQRAAESGASVRTQKMADKVARAAPELAKKVAHGEISLPKAVRQIAPASPKPSRSSVPPKAAPPAVPSAEAPPEARDAVGTLLRYLCEIADIATPAQVQAAAQTMTIPDHVGPYLESMVGTFRQAPPTEAAVLQERVQRLQADLEESRQNATELAAMLESYDVASQGEVAAAREIAKLKAQLRTVEATRDQWMRTAAEAKSQIKSLQRQVRTLEKKAGVSVG